MLSWLFFFAWHRRYLFLADVFFVFGSNICTSCISYFGPRGRETIFDIAQADWFSFISISVLCSQVEIESWAVLQFQCLFHFFWSPAGISCFSVIHVLSLLAIANRPNFHTTDEQKPKTRTNLILVLVLYWIACFIIFFLECHGKQFHKVSTMTFCKLSDFSNFLQSYRTLIS